MWHDGPSFWLGVAELIALVGGGLWALYIYRSSRRGQVSIAIEHSARFVHDFDGGVSVMLLRVRMRNTSGVLWRHQDAIVTVFDARKLADNGAVRLAPFAEDDPFLPLYGVMSDDPNDIPAGDTFRYFEGQEISLEPDEAVESELAFRLDPDKLGLMAVKIWFSGLQGRASRPYEWATFFYVDPNEEPRGEQG
jgi:hypothetical protein